MIVRAKERLDKMRAIFETDKNIARPAALLLNVLYEYFSQCEMTVPIGPDDFWRLHLLIPISLV